MPTRRSSAGASCRAGCFGIRCGCASSGPRSPCGLREVAVDPLPRRSEAMLLRRGARLKALVHLEAPGLLRVRVLTGREDDGRHSLVAFDAEDRDVDVTAAVLLRWRGCHAASPRIGTRWPISPSMCGSSRNSWRCPHEARGGRGEWARAARTSDTGAWDAAGRASSAQRRGVNAGLPLCVMSVALNEWRDRPSNRRQYVHGTTGPRVPSSR